MAGSVDILVLVQITSFTEGLRFPSKRYGLAGRYTETTACKYVLVKEMSACFNKRVGYRQPVECWMLAAHLCGDAQFAVCGAGLHAGLVAEKRRAPIRRPAERGGGRVPAIFEEIGEGKAYPHCERVVMVSPRTA
jgi:hypothetical protein